MTPVAVRWNSSLLLLYPAFQLHLGEMTLDNMAYMYPSFPIIGTISMLLCLYPVPAHWRSGNIATVSLALWTSIGLLQCVIDTCVWHGNIRNPYPIWGDIVNVYFAVLSTAIAGCELCIQYRLWQVVRAKSVFVTKREVCIDLVQWPQS